jgi:puromycin-sensitive aminopeptidase
VRGDGKVEVRFADTMVMSTYLVAFVVGPFEITDPVDVRGTPLRVVCPRGKVHLTSFALEVGAFCLEYFADYYEIPYPGDKCDLVAVPDFAFGAMENLGCITFREVLLLVEPDEVTQPELQRVTDVIAHELAHMWFGDLVTMKWWNGIWLNEAFATFMEMKATDAFRPEWDRWTDFGLSRTAAMDTDALRSTRPIEYEVVSPDDAEGMFDVLTYEKGAAVVRMLEQYLGEDPFRDGIRSYLATHAYGNTETTDLWDSLEAVTGEPVRRIMDSWIFQAGMPVIDVDLVNDAGTLRLTQERFRYLSAEDEGLEPDPDEDARRWAVPVIFSQSHDGLVTFEKVLLDGDSVDIAEFETVDWLLGNTEGIGFYRCLHAPTITDSLVAHADALSPIERYGLLDDLWATALADRVAATTVIDHLEGFGGERDLSVWQRIVGILRSVDHLLDDDAARAGFRARVARLVAPAAAALGPDARDDDSDRDRQLRGVLFDALGTLADDAGVEVRARDLHRAAVAGDAVDPSLLAAAIRVIAVTGGHEEFDGFLERFRSAATPQEEIRYLYALAEFDDDGLVDRVLAMCLSGEIRTQNAPYLLGRLLSHRTQGPRAWAFIRDNWDALGEAFPSNSIVRMLEGIRSLSHPADADSVFAFFTTHEVPQGDKQLAQHLERLEVNVAFRLRETTRLEQHLR